MYTYIHNICIYSLMNEIWGSFTPSNSLIFYAKCCMYANLCIILKRNVFLTFSRHLSLKKGKNHSLTVLRC